MKRFIPLLLIVLFFGKNARAQYGLEPAILPPTGYYSYILKPGIGAQFFINVIGGSKDDDSQFKLAGILGYFRFSSTQDTLLAYGLGGNPVQFLPGYEVLHSLEMFTFGARGELKILKDARLSPIFGLDFQFHIYQLSEDTHIETLETSSTTNDIYFNYCLIPRLGAEYKLSDNWLLSAGLGYDKSFGGNYLPISFWHPFINAVYLIK